MPKFVGHNVLRARRLQAQGQTNQSADALGDAARAAAERGEFEAAARYAFSAAELLTPPRLNLQDGVAAERRFLADGDFHAATQRRVDTLNYQLNLTRWLSLSARHNFEQASQYLYQFYLQIKPRSTQAITILQQAVDVGRWGLSAQRYTNMNIELGAAYMHGQQPAAAVGAYEWSLESIRLYNIPSLPTAIMVMDQLAVAYAQVANASLGKVHDRPTVSQISSVGYASFQAAALYFVTGNAAEAHRHLLSYATFLLEHQVCVRSEPLGPLHAALGLVFLNPMGSDFLARHARSYVTRALASHGTPATVKEAAQKVLGAELTLRSRGQRELALARLQRVTAQVILGNSHASPSYTVRQLQAEMHTRFEFLTALAATAPDGVDVVASHLRAVWAEILRQTVERFRQMAPQRDEPLAILEEHLRTCLRQARALLTQLEYSLRVGQLHYPDWNQLQDTSRTTPGTIMQPLSEHPMTAEKLKMAVDAVAAGDHLRTMEILIALSDRLHVSLDDLTRSLTVPHSNYPLMERAAMLVGAVGMQRLRESHYLQGMQAMEQLHWRSGLEKRY